MTSKGPLQPRAFYDFVEKQTPLLEGLLAAGQGCGTLGSRAGLGALRTGSSVAWSPVAALAGTSSPMSEPTEGLCRWVVVSLTLQREGML